MSLLTLRPSLSEGTQQRIINSYTAINHDLYFFISPKMPNKNTTGDKFQLYSYYFLLIQYNMQLVCVN